MSDPCASYTNATPVTQVQTQILCDGQSPVHWADEECLSARPRREKAREEISDYVLLMLGAPVVRLELDIQQVTLAVDQALSKFEQFAPRKYFQYYYFTTSPESGRYKMPCDVGIIRNVIFQGVGTCGKNQVDYLGDGSVIPWVGGMFPGMTYWGAGFGGSGAFGPWGYPSYGSLSEWNIFKGYQELFQRMTSSEPSWEFGPDNTLQLYPVPRTSIGVGVEYLQRKKDWNSVDMWIKEYALALAKQMLGRIRSKFDRFVTPSGGVALDGPTLLSEGKEEKTALEEQLITRYAVDHMLPMWG